jgi:indole-3-glycerol phosphate synthase
MTIRLPHQTGTVLDDIVRAKRKRLDLTKERVPLKATREMAEAMPAPLSLEHALRSRPGVAVIAEMKRASASAGPIVEDLDPERQAHSYCKAGAAAISVLTEQDFFFGTVADLARVHTVSRPYGVPVLQKDFIFEEYQVYEARAHGADAVLLIMALLGRGLYRGLLELIHGLRMDALVEVFDEWELETALAEGPRIVGVNNRNLKTLSTSLDVFARVSRHIPEGKLAVAESGMKSLDDVRRMAAAGAKAVLVGEWLMRSGGKAGELINAMSRIQTR